MARRHADMPSSPTVGSHGAHKPSLGTRHQSARHPKALLESPGLSWHLTTTLKRETLESHTFEAISYPHDLQSVQMWQTTFLNFHFLISVCVLVAQSCPTLCDPMDCSPPGSSVHGILQAGTLGWVATSFSRGSSRPRDQTCVSCITGKYFKYG